MIHRSIALVAMVAGVYLVGCSSDVPDTGETSVATISTKAVQWPAHSTSFGRAKDMQGESAPGFVVDSWVANEVVVDNKVRVVEFWATWCPPCRRSIPHLNEMAKEFGDSVAFVGVSAEAPEKIRTFMKKTPMNYGVACDPQKRMQKAVNCSAIPLALVISSDGVVRWQGNPIRLKSEDIAAVVKADASRRRN
jgi:thiol-disulfide isomerase/thioredoxin